MALYDALYSRKCRSPISSVKAKEIGVVGPELIQTSNKKIVLIRDHLRTNQNKQKSYTYKHLPPVEYSGDVTLCL